MKKKIIIAMCLLTGINIAGCKKFTEVPPPTTQLSNTLVFSNSASANAASTSVFYNIALNLSWQTEVYTGMSGDEIIPFQTGADDLTLYQNDAIANNYDTYSLWKYMYELVYQANAVIDGVNSSTGLTGDLKNQLVGEAEFSRAYLYFYLTNLFGDVPLVTSSNYATSVRASRSPQAAVYQQILNDLKNAENLLTANYVGADGLTTSAQKLRPNKAVVTAFLARVYLYMKDYKDAETAATAIINSGSYKLVSNLNSVFLTNSTEAIFQTMCPPLNTEDGFEWILGVPYYTLNSFFLANFEVGDNRKTAWVTSQSSGGVTYYIPYKYKIASTTAAITEFTMMLRLAEQYLIRAEAEVNNNETGAAIADLNVIRNRAGLPNYTGANDNTSLLAAILHERQVEFFTEEGHRWLDLKRSGTIDAVMSIITPKKGGNTWVSTQKLWPIPQTEIIADPNLTQNAGY